MTQPTVFISYSHEDGKEKDRLLTHLGVLQHAGLIDLWNDDRIAAGGDWEQEINQAITQAKVAILLITANFLTSDFILGQEVPALLKRRQREGLVVFPVIAKACAWQAVDWLRQMNVRPKSGNPVWGDSGSHSDEDLAAIATEVAIIINEAKKQQAHLFICYKQHAIPDHQLATYLHETLTSQGHDVFIDQTMRTGDDWLDKIDEQIKGSEFLIVLLSKESADSEMVQAEVRRAYNYRKLQGKPHTLPVRIAYEGLLPYSIDAFLDPIQYVSWHSEADNEQVAQEIIAVIQGQPLQQPTPKKKTSSPPIKALSEDGRPVFDESSPHPPLPEFDPRSLKELAVPGGAVKLNDKLYIEREADAQLKKQIARWGTTTTIRAPRQTGKTSLLVRGIHYAREQGANVVFLDFQSFDADHLISLDLFLEELAWSISDELELDEDVVEQAWAGKRSASKKILRFMEQHVLPRFDEPIVLAMDEADSLLQTDFYKDFFGLLRSWHNRRASREIWEKLNIVLVISTEPYLLIDDIHHSPFNVGLNLGLTDFDESQVRNLNYRHGLPIAESDLPHLMTLLNGHPFLTRRALYTMVTMGETWANLNQRAPADNGPFGDHLRHQYWIIRDKPELKRALKEIIHTSRCSDETTLFRLLRAGLVKGSGDIYTCRCDLYKLYFEDKLF